MNHEYINFHILNSFYVCSSETDYNCEIGYVVDCILGDLH